MAVVLYIVGGLIVLLGCVGAISGFQSTSHLGAATMLVSVGSSLTMATGGLGFLGLGAVIDGIGRLREETARTNGILRKMLPEEVLEAERAAVDTRNWSARDRERHAAGRA